MYRCISYLLKRCASDEQQHSASQSPTAFLDRLRELGVWFRLYIPTRKVACIGVVGDKCRLESVGSRYQSEAHSTSA
jgi:hypothetical protein